MKENWAAKEVVTRDVSELIPYDRNPKDHPDSQIEQIANSIREWGWTIPILIDEKENVIAGHGRLYAAQSMGIAEVPCLVARGWTDDQRRAYVIADNKIGENGSWNLSTYFEELQIIEGKGFDLSLIGIEGDLSFANYQPNLEPVLSSSEVNSNDLERAATAKQNQIDNIQENADQNAREVTCPHCAETFYVET